MRVPAINGDPLCAPQNNAWTNTSTAEIALPTGGGNGGFWVTLKPVGAAVTDHVHIAFGAAGFVPAATTSDSIYFSYQEQDYWIPLGVTAMRIIGSTANAGVLKWHRSSK